MSILVLVHSLKHWFNTRVRYQALPTVRGLSPSVAPCTCALVGVWPLGLEHRYGSS